MYYTPPKYADGTVIIFHHGAGYAALSFACLAKELKDMSNGELGVLALDARRHGEFVCCNYLGFVDRWVNDTKGKTAQMNHDEPENEDLSIDTLVSDFTQLAEVLFPDPTKAPSLLVGPTTSYGSSAYLYKPSSWSDIAWEAP